MDEVYLIESVDEPAWAIIGGGLRDYNNQQAGEEHGKDLCFILRSPDGAVVGGIIGETHWNWLYINLMWIKQNLRGRGYGAQLLAAAEDEGSKRGAVNAYLDTFSFQAPDFYKKHGYKKFGVLEDFPPGHKRYYLTKKLLKGNPAIPVEADHRLEPNNCG